MYANTVTLIGFLGSDPDRRETKNNNSFTVLSLATKTSWKNKQTGEWESRTEWHRAISYGSLADFAATLKKGAHVQIQGELRSREYDKPLEGKKKATIKQRIWEIQVNSILKLDRAQRVDEIAGNQEPVEDPEATRAFGPFRKVSLRKSGRRRDVPHPFSRYRFPCKRESPACCCRPILAGGQG